MSAPPPNPLIELSTPAQRWVVLAAADAATSPVVADEQTALQALRITRSAGGQQLDSCALRIDLELAEHRAEDEIPAYGAVPQQVEIRLADVFGDIDTEILFWGEIGLRQIGISDGEQVTALARVEPRHFDTALDGQVVKDAGGTRRVTRLPLVFNPEIDGQILANMSSLVGANGEQLWVDPESVRTSAAQTVAGQTASLWTLAEAVHTLCWLCNPDQTHIDNPALADLQEVLAGAPLLRNVTLPLGRYLPELLDLLLQPHGYNWYLRAALVSGVRTLTITLFQRGVGDEVELFLQAAGSGGVDPADTNVSDIGIEWNTADLANGIYCLGSFYEREVTIELLRGWAAADDALTVDELSKSDEAGISVFATKPNVHRKWVADEAGDYDTLRTGHDTAGAAIRSGLITALGASSVPKRRQPFPCLTLDSDGHRRDPVVEWYDADDSTWKPAPGARVLETELGVYFDGDTPPDYLLDADTPRVRLTCCVRGDTAVFALAAPQPTSPNSGTIYLVVDVSDRFHNRLRSSGGTLDSVLTGDADEANDTAALETYAEKLRAIEDSARVTAEVKLPGIAREYEIGQLVTALNGRDISLNRNAADNATKKYPQIVGITYTAEPPETVLRLESVNEVI